MKNKIKFLACFFILLTAFALKTNAQNDKNIKEIQRIYQETAEKQAECESNGETSSVFLMEIIVNKNNGSYPAVGIYQKTVKFYYTYGNREKNPYPSRLLKITVSTKRASQDELSEFLFDSRGKLVFYFEKKQDTEKRIYFVLEKPIKSLKNNKTISIKNVDEIKFTQSVLQESQTLKNVFTTTLE